MPNQNLISSVTVEVTDVPAARARALKARQVAERAKVAAEEAQRTVADAERAEPGQLDRGDPVEDCGTPESAEVVPDPAVQLEVPVTDARRGKRLWAWCAFATIAVASLAAAGLSVYFVADHRQVQSRADEDAKVLQAARAEVTNLLTISNKDIEGYSNRVLDDATGIWRQEFTKNKAAVIGVLAVSNDTVGRVVQAGIEERHGDTVSVLVSASTSAAVNAPADQPGTSVRMRVEVTESDGRYKLAKVEIVQ